MLCAQAQGLVDLMLDFDLGVETVIHTDSTAALGMVHRKGFGKVRHIKTTKCTVRRCR